MELRSTGESSACFGSGRRGGELALCEVASDIRQIPWRTHDSDSPVARDLRHGRAQDSFSHLALINTAHNLMSTNGAVHQRSARSG